MADIIPSESAVLAVQTLRQRFVGIDKPSEEMLFTTFAEVCTMKELGGELFASLPESFFNQYPPDHELRGQKLHFRVYAAWFRQEGYPDAFAAVIYQPDTGGSYFTHDYDAGWPSWLNDLLLKLTLGIRSAEMDRQYPPPSNTLN